MTIPLQNVTSAQQDSRARSSLWVSHNSSPDNRPDRRIAETSTYQRLRSVDRDQVLRGVIADGWARCERSSSQDRVRHCAKIDPY